MNYSIAFDPTSDTTVVFPQQPLVVRFTVLGTARPQGSKRHVGNGVMIEMSKGLKPWRQEVAGMAMNFCAGRSLPLFKAHVPVELTLNFYFSRPKSASAKKRPGMTTRPDGSKLLRAVEDALTGILFHDDAQVIEIHVRKHYGGPDRVEIEVREGIA